MRGPRESNGEVPGGKVRVVVVDDHDVWREGVRSLMRRTEFEVVGEASSGPEALERVRALAPRLVLMDIRMAGGDGLDALQAMKAHDPGVAVILLSTYDNPTYLARAAAGGAAGYLLKGTGRDDLLRALRTVVGGGVLLRPEDVARGGRRHGAAPAEGAEGAAGAESGDYDLLAPLTRREREVLRLLAAGLSNRDIASVLTVAESTVKTHVDNILAKLGVSDRVQAAVWAARHGLAPELE